MIFYLSLFTPAVSAALKKFIRIYFRKIKTYPKFLIFFINTCLKTDQKWNLRSHKNKNIYTGIQIGLVKATTRRHTERPTGG